MVFSSIPFLFFFLPACLILYYAVPFRAKNYILLIFSLAFYAWGEPVCILLMLFASFVDYLDGRLMTKFDDRPGIRRLCLAVSAAVNLSMLGFFKYADFAVETVNALAHTEFQPPGIGLPIGISFFTFQTMSYSIDLYRRNVTVERNYLTYLTYVSMFPQLIAGPIVRFRTVQKELHERTIDPDGFSLGMLRFLQGLFKKVLIANNVGALWEMVRANQLAGIAAAGAGITAAGAGIAAADAGVSAAAGGGPAALTAWFGAVLFTFQLYFDFSAYSDMAIGMGRMLGFHFLENFNYPLCAVSVTDFWRRWHISLSTWFRDYVYIPLGGNRKGKWKQIRNIMIVWTLTGLWHGAAWNFVLWGVYYGVLLILEKYVWGKHLEKLPGALRHLYSFLIVVFGFTIFVFDDMGELKLYILSMTGRLGNPLFGAEILWYIRNDLALLTVTVLLAFGFFNFRKKLPVFAGGAAAGTEQAADSAAAGNGQAAGGELAAAGQAVSGRQTVFRVLTMLSYAALFLLSAAYLVNDSYNPFLYFRF